LFGVALSAFWTRLSRETLSGRELAQNGLAALFVAVGVALVR